MDIITYINEFKSSIFISHLLLEWIYDLNNPLYKKEIEEIKENVDYRLEGVIDEVKRKTIIRSKNSIDIFTTMYDTYLKEYINYFHKNEK